jgi:fructosamine-3-kinase
LTERRSPIPGLPVIALRRVGGEHGISHAIATLSGGGEAFVKSGPGFPADGPSAETGDDPADGDGGGVAAEANGLRWLAAAPDGAPVPAVLAAGATYLAIEYLPPGHPTPEAAERFGAELARTHAAGADGFGAPWPGWIAGLPLDNAAGEAWPRWYAERRLLPYLRRARDAGTLSSADAGVVEAVIDRIDDLAGPPEPPARIHGDLWSGNVLWSGGRGWLIDPAAHGGHRETDLAMLALFSAPYLDRILAAYTDVSPLADGWRSRIPLHQLHPLLLHVNLYGPAYRSELLAAARSAPRP